MSESNETIISCYCDPSHYTPTGSECTTSTHQACLSFAIITVVIFFIILFLIIVEVIVQRVTKRDRPRMRYKYGYVMKQAIYTAVAAACLGMRRMCVYVSARLSRLPNIITLAPIPLSLVPPSTHFFFFAVRVVRYSLMIEGYNNARNMEIIFFIPILLEFMSFSFLISIWYLCAHSRSSTCPPSYTRARAHIQIPQGHLRASTNWLIGGV